MLLTVRTTLAIVLAAAPFAPKAKPAEFEVASIKPFDPSSQGKVLAGLHVDGAQVRAAGLSLRDLLAMAYKIKATLITGPDWTASARFDISATLPAGSTPAQLPEMFQALLADRFGVKVHTDNAHKLTMALFAGNLEVSRTARSST
jgi:uncharacterized protein (TIGR03435 family)